MNYKEQLLLKTFFSKVKFARVNWMNVVRIKKGK